jgi:hypothetical protein
MAQVPVKRIILFAGALLVSLMIFVVFFVFVINPNMETVPKAKASLTAHNIAIYVSFLSQVESGVVARYLDGIFDVYIGKSDSGKGDYFVTVTLYDEKGVKQADSERAYFVTDHMITEIEEKCKDSWGKGENCKILEKKPLIQIEQRQEESIYIGEASRLLFKILCPPSSVYCTSTNQRATDDESAYQYLYPEFATSAKERFEKSITSYEFLVKEGYTATSAARVSGAVSSDSHNRRDSTIEYIVLHHTSGNRATDALEYWASSNVKASAHYIVEKDGTVIQCVPEERAAWHAGCSGTLCFFPGMNSISIGIEIVNRGDGQDEYTPEQKNALNELIEYLVEKYGIERGRIVGHGWITANRQASEPTGFNPEEAWSWTLCKRSTGACPIEV